MKQNLSIAILLLLLCVSSYTQAQKVEVVFPEEDPVRLQEASDRPQRQASVTAPDTTRLPFFEDFTDPLVPVDLTQTVNAVPSAVQFTTLGLHGLQNGDSILVFNVKNTEYATLNDTFYVKKISKFIFQLYTDKALTTFFPGNGATITQVKWAKMPYDPLSIIIPSTPDVLKWMDNNGGTYVNDRYPVEPISYNVATFDGLMYNGVQYNSTNFNAQGFADNLTSVPIDLGGLLPQDSVYLLFYWQCAGVGEAPETNDYLVLEVKDNTDMWTEIWRMYGNTSAAATEHFTPANVAIIDPDYLYNGFQFRFRNRGRLSGPFDIWNLDYIYLNKGGMKLDTITPDWTVSYGQHTFLKNYTSMPYEHFFADTASERSPTQLMSVINLAQIVPIHFSNVSFIDNTDNVNTILMTSENGLPPSGYTYRHDSHLHFNYTLAVPNTNKPRSINLLYKIPNQTDANTPYFGNNNYYTTNTILWNYFAYDDGTPEYAIKTVAGGVNIANKYQLSSIKDTITAIDYCFTRNAGINMEGRTIFLTVWDHNNVTHKPGSVIHQQQIDIAYPTPADGFVRYQLDAPVYLAATDTFYVGYVQNFIDPLFIGYDASVDHSDKMFYNDGAGWVSYNSQIGYIPGSLMIRPVFENGQILTPVTDPLNDNFVVNLYPNPADDQLYVEGNISEIVITDLLGRTIFTYTSTQEGNAQHTLNISSIADGLYLVRLVAPNGATKTEKLLVR